MILSYLAICFSRFKDYNWQCWKCNNLKFRILLEWPGNLKFSNSVYLQWIICCAFHLDFLFFWLVISLRFKRSQMSSLISKIHVFLCRTNTSRCLLGKFSSATQAFLSVAPYIHKRCTLVSKIVHWELEVVGEKVEYSINCT